MFMFAKYFHNENCIFFSFENSSIGFFPFTKFHYFSAFFRVNNDSGADKQVMIRTVRFLSAAANYFLKNGRSHMPLCTVQD